LEAVEVGEKGYGADRVMCGRPPYSSKPIDYEAASGEDVV